MQIKKVVPQSKSAQEGVQYETKEQNNETAEFEKEDIDPAVCSVQNARGVADCKDCDKPRDIYSRHKLTD